jgi:hypothetical protein
MSRSGFALTSRRATVMKAVEGYRFNARRLRSFGVLEAWYLHTYPGRDNPVSEFLRIPYNIAKARNHPHQECDPRGGVGEPLHVACHLAIPVDMGNDLPSGARLRIFPL